MARTHKSETKVLVEREDDLWLFFEVAERVVTDFAEGRTGDVVEFTVDFQDQDGGSSETSAAAARAESDAQRSPPERIAMSANIKHPEPDDPFVRPTIWVRVRTAHLDMTERNPLLESWEPQIGISVDSTVSEQEAVGLAEVIRRDIQHEVDQARARRARTHSASGSPVEGDAPSPTPAAHPEPQGASEPFYKNVAAQVVGGLLLVIILAVAGMLWGVFR